MARLNASPAPHRYRQHRARHSIAVAGCRQVGNAAVTEARLAAFDKMHQGEIWARWVSLDGGLGLIKAATDAPAGRSVASWSRSVGRGRV
jgi:hypothetical protein